MLRWHLEHSNTSKPGLKEDTSASVSAMHSIGPDADAEDELEDSDSDEYAQTLADALNIADLTVDTIKDLLYRTLRNSFAIPDRFNDEMARGIYPSASLFNHSCRPNAWAFFSEKAFIRIVALSNIKKGDEICISYLNGFEAPQLRRLELRRTFGFWCDCDYCSSHLKTIESDVTEIFNCEKCHDIRTLHDRSLQANTAEEQRAVLELLLKNSNLEIPTPESHEFLHCKSLLDAFYLARVLRDYQELIKIGTALQHCYDYLELPSAAPIVFLLHYQLALCYASLLKWKKATEHFALALSGMEVARSELLQETGYLIQLTREPSSFVEWATKLASSPSLSPAVEELLAHLNDRLTDPEFGIIS